MSVLTLPRDLTQDHIVPACAKLAGPLASGDSPVSASRFPVEESATDVWLHRRDETGALDLEKGRKGRRSVISLPASMAGAACRLPDNYKSLLSYFLKGILRLTSLLSE